MDQDRLHALLVELDRELRETPSLDARSEELLRRVLADIPQQAASARPDPSAEARLRELVVHFEAGNPRLSAVVGQVADALGKLGI